MDEICVERLRRRIGRQYEILSILDDRLNAVRRRRAIETDPSISFKLQADEQEVQSQITATENEIEKLNNRLASGAFAATPEDAVSGPVPLEFSAKLQYDIIPTGIYHLFDPDVYPLVKYEISNPSTRALTVMVTTQILRYSDMTRTTRIVKGSTELAFGHLPTLVPSEMEQLTAIKHATLHIKISVSHGSELILKDDAFPVQMHARDTIPWLLQNVDSGEIYDLSKYIAAWTTPNTKEIEAILRQAVDRHPSNAILGYQGGRGCTHEERRDLTRSQVNAMFQVLKEETGIAYVNAPITFGHKVGEAMQRVRLPRRSLEVGAANCIDGTVLFASLIETAAMNPVIILVPGHAFVGWETWQGSGQYDYLETTMIRDAPFEEALTQGSVEYQDAVHAGLFHNGRGKCIDINQARISGILPME